MKPLYALVLLPLLLYGGDYDFDMDAIEAKPYTTSGYLRGEHKHQILNDASPKYPSKNKNSMQTYLSEANLKFASFKEKWKMESEFIANADFIDGDFTKEFTVAQLSFEYKFDINHLVEVGKKAPKWGKGYFVNPIAFFDRKKNPDDPEASREGYTLANYRYNKSYSGDLQNLTFDVLALQNSDNVNEDFNANHGTNVGLKLYMLYLDTDIEFVYMYASGDEERVGLDFSKNLQTNFEIHGEFAKTLGIDDYKFLVGLRYLTSSELTITSEYFYQKNQSFKTEPFFDNAYLMSKISQKEPFAILYSSLYYKNIYNLEDDSMQNSIGATYSFKNDMFLDLSYNTNGGDVESEYGSKLIEKTIWTRLTWYF